MTKRKNLIMYMGAITTTMLKIKTVIKHKEINIKHNHRPHHLSTLKNKKTIT